MKKVLIISYHFPPLNTMGAKRYGIMCKYMKLYGYEPMVLTTNVPQKLEAGFSNQADIKQYNLNNEMEIIRIGKFQKSIVKSAGINFFLSLLEERKLVLRSLDSNSYGWYEECRKAAILKDLRKIVKPDIILATFPDIGDVYVAKYLSELWSVPYVVDIRDLISEYAEVDQGYRKSFIIDNMIEKWLLKDAAALVAVTSGFKNILRHKYHKKTITIFNGWDDKIYDNMKNEEPTENYMYYAGRFYEHRISSFEILLDALQESSNKDIKFIIRGTGSGELLRKLEKMVKSKKLQDRVYILPPVKEEIVKKEQEKARIHIVFSDTDDTKDYLLSTIPGKLMELLAYSSPILAVAADKSEIAQVLRQTGKGIAVKSKNEINKFLSGGYLNYRGNEKAINYYSRKNQTKKLCAFMDLLI